MATVNGTIKCGFCDMCWHSLRSDTIPMRIPNHRINGHALRTWCTGSRQEVKAINVVGISLADNDGHLDRQGLEDERKAGGL